MSDREAFTMLGAVMFFIASLAASWVHKSFDYSPWGSLAIGAAVSVVWLIVGMCLVGSSRRGDGP